MLTWWAEIIQYLASSYGVITSQGGRALEGRFINITLFFLPLLVTFNNQIIFIFVQKYLNLTAQAENTNMIEGNSCNGSVRCLSVSLLLLNLMISNQTYCQKYVTQHLGHSVYVDNLSQRVNIVYLGKCPDCITSPAGIYTFRNSQFWSC